MDKQEREELRELHTPPIEDESREILWLLNRVDELEAEVARPKEGMGSRSRPMTKRDLGEPWCADANADNDHLYSEGDGLPVVRLDSYDTNLTDCALAVRIAAYSQAFSDIEDPVAWRDRVYHLLGYIEGAIAVAPKREPWIIFQDYLKEIRALQGGGET